MITLKIYQGKWRMKIENEEWEFKDRKDFISCLISILDYKESNGKIKNEY